MPSSVLKIESSRRDGDMTEELLVRTLVQLVSDGYHTVTEAMSGVMHLLAAHPGVQERIQEEIDRVLDGKEDVGAEDLSQLVYLEQVGQICRVLSATIIGYIFLLLELIVYF